MEQNSTIRRITVHGREVNSERRSFIAFSANINGVWYKIKFTRAVTNVPRKKGLYEMSIDLKSCSTQKGAFYDDRNGVTRQENDTIWIKDLIEWKEASSEQYEALNVKTMLEIFGEVR